MTQVPVPVRLLLPRWYGWLAARKGVTGMQSGARDTGTEGPQDAAAHEGTL